MTHYKRDGDLARGMHCGGSVGPVVSLGSTEDDNSTPAARRGRKVRGLTETARPPNLLPALR